MHIIKPYKQYSKYEEEFIKDNYLIHSDRWIALQLKREPNRISEKRKRMQLHKSKGRHLLARKDAQDSLNIRDIQFEIKALVFFIETTHSEVWRDIANTRRKQLLTELKYLNR